MYILVKHDDHRLQTQDHTSHMPCSGWWQLMRRGALRWDLPCLGLTCPQCLQQGLIQTLAFPIRPQFFSHYKTLGRQSNVGAQVQDAVRLQLPRISD